MKKKLKYALINAAIAGGLVLLGSFSSGIITWKGLVAGIAAGLIVFLAKIKVYVNKMRSKKGMKGGIFEFL